MYSFAAAAFFDVIGDRFSDEGGSLSCLNPLLEEEDSFSLLLFVFFFTESLSAENHDFFVVVVVCSFSFPPPIFDSSFDVEVSFCLLLSLYSFLISFGLDLLLLLLLLLQ